MEEIKLAVNPLIYCYSKQVAKDFCCTFMDDLPLKHLAKL